MAQGAAAVSAGHQEKTTEAVAASFLYLAPGAWIPLPTHRQTGSRKAEVAAFASRPQTTRTASWALGSLGAGFRLRHCCVGLGTSSWRTREGGGPGQGGAEISGERQVRPRGAGDGTQAPFQARTRDCHVLRGPSDGRGGVQRLQDSRRGSEAARNFCLCLPRSIGRQPPSPAVARQLEGPGWVRCLAERNSDQRAAARKHLGSHKPPEVKVRVTQRPLTIPTSSSWFTSHSTPLSSGWAIVTSLRKGGKLRGLGGSTQPCYQGTCCHAM